MLTRRIVEEQAARVTHQVDGLTFRWRITGAYEAPSPAYADRPEHVGWFVQMLYDEPDIDDPTGPPLEQATRKWLVPLEGQPHEVLQTMLKAALGSAEHRVREWFLVDGVRAYGPHQDVERLIDASEGPG